MNSKAKVATASLVLVAIASVLLYIPLTNAIRFNSAEISEVEILDCENFDVCQIRKRWLNTRRLWWFLNHSEIVEIDGTVVALFRNMLVVDTADGQTRILLPRMWTVNDKLMGVEEFFESHLNNTGITIKTLKAEVIDKEGLKIYILLGYEVVEPVDAYAVLPFNIED